ncbi:MAG: DUF2062 domain-containing protein [Geobacteraceae bacterium]
MVRRTIRNLVEKIFIQGISPQKLALTISLGIFIGTVPVIWGSTIICAALAFIFRLNQPGIQAANYLVYPIQLAMIVPFYSMGARIFPWGPSLPVDITLKKIMENWFGNIALILVATLKAIAAWLLIVAPLSLLLYFLLFSIFTRMPRFKDVSDNERK